MPSVTRLGVLLLLMCAGLSVLSFANSADVEIRASVFPAQVLLPVVPGGGILYETSPRPPQDTLNLLTVDLSNAEWRTSGSDLIATMAVEIRSNVPWKLSAEISAMPVWGQVEIRNDDGPAIPLDVSSTDIQHGDLGVHTLHILIQVSDGFSQEGLEAVSLILQLRRS